MEKNSRKKNNKNKGRYLLQGVEYRDFAELLQRLQNFCKSCRTFGTFAELLELRESLEFKLNKYRFRICNVCDVVFPAEIVLKIQKIRCTMFKKISHILTPQK